MFRLIAAIDQKRGLAKQGVIPWHIPEDEQFYQAQTKSLGGILLSGSTTYKAYHGHPLPGMRNFVLTHDKTPLEGVEVVNNLEKFLNEWQGKDVWVIGGANVFAQVMELGRADELYLTHIEAEFGCNQFFPPYADYQLIEQSTLHEQNGFIFTFAKYAPNKQ